MTSKSNYPHPILAREGWPFITVSVIVALLVWYLANFWAAIPFILIALFVVQFFRDPARTLPLDSDAILSAADGKVIVIEKAYDAYQAREALKISVFMNVFNVHSNRAPADSEVIDIKYFAGKFLNADLDKASTENERNALILRLESGQTVTCVQVAGLIARRIICYSQIGGFLRKGERYGFIRFGSRVDLYLPLEFVPEVSLGDKVKAGETILARVR